MVELNKIYQGDALAVLKTFPDSFVDCVVTSPPYFGLRDYGIDGQIGLEQSPEEYITKLVNIFSEVKRVLKPSGTCFLNIGDSYVTTGCSQMNLEKMNSVQRGNVGSYSAMGITRPIPDGCKRKEIMGIPWKVAFALQREGWYLRQDIIWDKRNTMPESMDDRFTRSHEYIFFLVKSERYYFKQVIEVGVDGSHNKRDVWRVSSGGNKVFKKIHYAIYPEELIEPCIKSGCPEGGLVLDPFMGTGTTAVVARRNFCNFIGVELDPSVIDAAIYRLS